jgi:polysaccharide export outer membrane protein
VVDAAIAAGAKKQPVRAEIGGLAKHESPSTIQPSGEPPVALESAEASAPVVTPPEIPKNRGVPDTYQIGAGDVLQVSVWKEPDASVPSVIVRPDGKISMPLLKEIEVAGQTPTQLERSITEKLSKFINAADVTVMITAINSKKVYIVGAARKEGTLPYTYRMRVLQAITEAGGLNEYAKRKNIYVLRTENGKEYQMPFNYDQVIRGMKMEQNIELIPGDTIIIPH